jgi:hypothetical protein
VIHDRIDFGRRDHYAPRDGSLEDRYRRNAVNLVTHPWVFRGKPWREDININQRVYMGIFNQVGLMEPRSSEPLGGSGNSGVASSWSPSLPWDTLRSQDVVMHNCHFSPNNCLVHLDDASPYHSWFSVVHHEGRYVAHHLHINPSHSLA